MNLSDKQMVIVTGRKNQGWENIPLPTGRQALPDWCVGAHVNWRDGVANAPDITVKVRGNVCDWPGKVWGKEGGGAYIARHIDGRCCVHYHKGGVSLVKIKDHRKKEFPVVEVMATEQQDGYGGRNIWLDMSDGTEMVLRGPWHGGAPDGYVEVYCADVTSEYFNRERAGKERPWYQRSKTYGLYIAEDLFMRIVATYLPHIMVAAVVKSYGRRLEPYRAEWGVLKDEIYNLEIERSRRKEPAGPFWRSYWDGRTAYCGSLRIPTYGFLPEVHDGDKPTQKEIDTEAARIRRRRF